MNNETNKNQQKQLHKSNYKYEEKSKVFLEISRLLVHFLLLSELPHQTHEIFLLDLHSYSKFGEGEEWLMLLFIKEPSLMEARF